MWQMWDLNPGTSVQDVCLAFPPGTAFLVTHVSLVLSLAHELLEESFLHLCISNLQHGAGSTVGAQ